MLVMLHRTGMVERRDFATQHSYAQLKGCSASPQISCNGVYDHAFIHVFYTMVRLELGLTVAIEVAVISCGNCSPQKGHPCHDY